MIHTRSLDSFRPALNRLILPVFYIRTSLRYCFPVLPNPPRSFEFDHRLMFHNAELADPVIDMDHRVSHCDHRHAPHVIISAVRPIHNPTVVCLNHTKIFVGAAARYNMRLISLRQFHGYPQRDQCKLSLLQADLLGCSQIDPVRFAVNILQSVNCIRKIFNLDLFHPNPVFLSLAPAPARQYKANGNYPCQQTLLFSIWHRIPKSNGGIFHAF